MFLEIVKSDKYPASFTDSPPFANQHSEGRYNSVFFAKQEEDDFSFKMSPQSIAGFGYWRNAGVTTEVSILVRTRSQVKTVKGYRVYA